MRMRWSGVLIVASVGATAFTACRTPRAPEGGEQTSPAVTTRPSQQAAQARSAAVADIVVPPGYEVEVAAANLDYPSNITFSPTGEMFVSEAGGHTYGTKPEKAPPARILEVKPDGSTRVIYDKVVPLAAIRAADSSEQMPEGIISPITGVTWRDGLLYVAHRTRISTLDPATGQFRTIVNGMPSWGEFLNHQVVFGPDDKMYWVLSTQGNSGNVDGHWIKVIEAFDKPDAQEYPCEDVTLTGLEFKLDNKLTPEKGDMISAPVYHPLGARSRPGEVVKGQFWCHGTVYRANADGSNIERVAWGLRSLYGYAFSPDGRLIATQNSGNVMQPRPIYDDWETVYEIKAGAWYGWPDFYSGVPITDPRFSRPNDPEFKGKPFPHAFALTTETHRRLLNGAKLPPPPLVKLPVHSAAEGLVFGRSDFGIPADEILVAEFGAIIPYYKDADAWPGFRVQRVKLDTGAISDFMVNRTQKPAWATSGGGLRRPLAIQWGPDGALYVVDFGVIHFTEKGMNAEPGTGVVWRVRYRGERQPETTGSRTRTQR